MRLGSPGDGRKAVIRVMFFRLLHNRGLSPDDDDLVPGEPPETEKGRLCPIFEAPDLDVRMRGVVLRYVPSRNQRDDVENE